MSILTETVEVCVCVCFPHHVLMYPYLCFYWCVCVFWYVNSPSPHLLLILGCISLSLSLSSIHILIVNYLPPSLLQAFFFPSIPRTCKRFVFTRLKWQMIKKLGGLRVWTPNFYIPSSDTCNAFNFFFFFFFFSVNETKVFGKGVSVWNFNSMNIFENTFLLYTWEHLSPF